METLAQQWVTLALGGLFVTYLLVGSWMKKLPSTSSIGEFITILNSRGGNILVLAVMSLYFFRQAMILFYAMLAQIQAGTLKENNALALMAVQFVTSSAFGGAMGALLKTMTGESSASRSVDRRPNVGPPPATNGSLTSPVQVSGGDGAESPSIIG